MKKLLTVLFSVFLLLSPIAGQQSGQKLLLAGSGWNKIVIIDKDTKQMEWEHSLEKGWECNSAAITPEGNILFAYSKGAKVISRDHKELWNITAPEGCEMQTARILPDGNYLLAWCGSPSTILEVNSKGDILSKTTYETGIKHPHSQFRQVNKTKKGNYLIPLFATSEVHEVSPKGELIQTIKVEGTPFSTILLKNGNYLVSCGDAHSLMEINLKKGSAARKIDQKGIEGITLFFVAQVLPAAKRGLYICNWQGHSTERAKEQTPQLVEIDKNGKMIWSLNDKTSFGMISTVSAF